MPDFTDSIKIQNQSLTIQDIEGLLINNINLSFSRIRPIDPRLFSIFDSIEELIQEKHNDYIVTTSTYLSRWVGNHNEDLSRLVGKYNAEKIDRDTADFFILKVEEQKDNPNKYNIFLVLALKFGSRWAKYKEPMLISNYKRNFLMLCISKEVCNKREEIKDIIDQSLSLNAISFDHTLKTDCDDWTNREEAYCKIYKPLKALYCNSDYYDSKYRILSDVNLSAFIETSMGSGDQVSHKIVKITQKVYKILTIDFLIIDFLGNPVLGIDYHDTEHNIDKHSDNIKRIVLQRAGVPFKIFENDRYKQRDVIYEVENCIKQYEKYRVK
ncbi:MAG: DUF2726 domain-containing protein [Solitalea-like symbiont of Acarus siro]